MKDGFYIFYVFRGFVICVNLLFLLTLTLTLLQHGPDVSSQHSIELHIFTTLFFKTKVIKECDEGAKIARAERNSRLTKKRLFCRKSRSVQELAKPPDLGVLKSVVASSWD